ncbi:factor VIII intron 22 protein [Exaiptasia diaphana]|uniref:Factor VIII intron 22 protein n=1 Tax=Exaiptasia diaphana TaxID=2652724 RepID=A0A913XMT3_EXADI|nr:factor VIII intron 22 protein [Exaiptasia diaphana]KXJ25489.1 Factor VIII intron 22 protein [Exaiptasia diaphana]
MDRNFDVLGQYRSVSSKLKRRFLKKPNVTEAVSHFGSLSKELQRQGCPQYSGFCCLAKARCENTLVNPVGEVEALTEAARLFLMAEQENLDMGCPSFEEHLTEAIHIYNQAIKVHCSHGNSALASCLCLELADALRGINRPTEAMVQYHHAAELQHQTPLAALNSMGHAASCKIDSGDFDGALSIFTEMAYHAQERGSFEGGSGFTIHSTYKDIITKCEINRVLLLMLLQPSPQKIQPEHAETLEKYLWDTEVEGSPIPWLCEELFILMQSLVMTCQARDARELAELEKDLWKFLNNEQKHLLHLVVCKITKSD